MGLYAQIDKGGFPDEIVIPLNLSGGFATEIIEYIDYTPAFASACQTFDEISRDLVPVDTGYLRSTLHSQYDEEQAEFFADAEYAQYVEFGTYKMDAQPYFEPAIEGAKQAFNQTAEMLVYEAEMNASMEIDSFNMSGGSVSALQSIMMMFFMLLLKVLIDEFFKLLSGNDGHSAGGGDIEIT